MYFVNSPFLFYFLPAGLAGYYLLGLFKRRAVQNVFLLLLSLVFLFFSEPLYLPLLAALWFFNYYLGRKIKTALWEGYAAKKYIGACYALNGGLFVAFQVLVAVVNHGGALGALGFNLFRHVVLPAGIAVFTLRAIGYVSDVYHKKTDAEQNALNLGLYLFFFPQIIVGPLMPYKEFRPQILERRFDPDRFYAGVCRLVTGIGKMVLLAGTLAVVTDTVFGLSAASETFTIVPAALAWLGLAAFCLQVYYQFSAYSDIAIGLGGMLGFDAPENFNYPYIANSVTAFWDRWLITIKGWFERYIARPLNRKRSANSDQRVINILVAFIAMGIWQKVTWASSSGRCCRCFAWRWSARSCYGERRIPKVVKHVYVAAVILISCALLRPNNLYETLLFFRNLFGMNQNGFFSPLALSLLREYWVFIVGAIVLLFPIAPALRKRIDRGGVAVKRIGAVAYTAALFVVVWLCVLYISRGLYTPDAYFSF
jgi:alginate O-acetyltransferase complex protein AlgI